MTAIRELTGRAAEHRVLSELLLRGVQASIVDFDDGYDIILANGYKVQVRCRQTPDKYGKYTFVLNPKNVEGRQVDFIIAWLLKENVFYIIPYNLISRGGFGLWANPEEGYYKKAWFGRKSKEKKEYKYKNYKEAWQLLTVRK